LVGFLVLLFVATCAIAWAGFVMLLSAMRRIALIEKELGLSSDQKAPANPPGFQPARPPFPPAGQPRGEAAGAGDEAPAPQEDKAPEPTGAKAGAGAQWAAETGRAAKRGDAQPGKEPSFFAKIESSLAGNWLVWLAGAALALGGLFIAKYAFDQGLLGPWARVALAAAAGAAMLAGSEYLRRKPDIAGAARSLAPPVLAGAGLITLYGDVYAAHAAFALIPGPVAFGLLAVIAALALFLAWLHGPVIAGFGIAGGFAAPLLIGAESPNAAGLFLYVFVVTAGSLAVARYARWRWTVWLSLAGGAGWPLLWLAGAFDPSQALALAIYLPALVLTAIAFAWREGDGGEAVEDPDLTGVWLDISPVSVLAAHACLIAACLLSLMLILSWDFAAPAIAALGVICTAGMGAAWRREGFALFPLITVLTAGTALYMWPDWMAAASIAEGEALSETTDGGQRSFTPFLTAAIFFMALFGAGGYLALSRLRRAGPMAVAAAAAPVGILILMAVKLDGLAPVWMWSVLLFAVAAVECAITEIFVRRDEAEERPAAPAAYALGASAAALAGLALVLSDAWLAAAIAAEAAAAAWLWRRWAMPALIWTIIVMTLLTVLQLTVRGDYLVNWGGGWIAAGGLVLSYVAALGALEGAARLLRGGGMARESAVVRTLEGAVMTLAVVTGAIVIRLVLNGGFLTAGYSLVEAGIQSGLWLAVPLALRLRIKGDLTLVQRTAEGALVSLAVIHVLLVQLLLLNPWMGANGTEIFGPPVFNALAIGYGLPAVLAAALTVVWRRRGFAAGNPAAFLTTVLFFAWITLETRRAFHAPDLSSGAVSDAEGWAYSAVWLAGAALAMAAGVIRRTPVLRYAALGVFTLVTFKVFLLDMAGLQGMWRGLSFLGLGAVLMAIAVTYQRVILPAERARAGRGGEA